MTPTPKPNRKDCFRSKEREVDAQTEAKSIRTIRRLKLKRSGHENPWEFLCLDESGHVGPWRIPHGCKQ